MYDSRGRLAAEIVEITGVGTYTTRQTYNSADQLAGMTYPSGEHVSTFYNPQGLVTEVDSNYWMIYALQAKYDEAGRLLERTLGNGVKTSSTYNPWNEQGGRLESTSSITSQTPATTRQHLAYSYDANGNISAIQDTVASETLNYSYDLLDRLTGVSGAYSQSYGYNAATGNLDSKAGQTLVYADTNHPHAATGMGSNMYAYDANGNMVSRQISTGTYTLSYDAESRLVGISGGGMSASYTYNGDGKRVKAVVLTGSDIKTTAYIGDYFEVSVGDPKPVTAPTLVDCSMTICLYLPLVISSSPQIPAGHAWTSYYTAGGSRVAMRVKSNQDGVEDGVFYFLTDHLGGTTITLDPTGNLVSELRYSAWGETRTSTGVTPTQRRYTGQLQAEVGLYFYNARWFDPGLGRFAQADSLIPGPRNPLAWDRYTHIDNNPVNGRDPTGHWVESLIDIVSIGYDIFEISTNGLNWENGLSLAADIASLVLPGVAGGGIAVRAAMHTDDAVDTYRAVDKACDANLAIKTGAYSSELVEDLANGLGKLDGKSIEISDKGLEIVKSHLSLFDDVPENRAMVSRLGDALKNGDRLTGADASFYLHEVSESTYLSKGMDYDSAHASALKKYDVSPYSVYHPEVIKQYPDYFNQNWRNFWKILE